MESSTRIWWAGASTALLLFWSRPVNAAAKAAGTWIDGDRAGRSHPA